MFRNFLFFLLLLLALPTSAQLADARQLLSTTEYPAQIIALDSLVAGGKVSPALYQALGNAHFHEGAFGKAILNYERGLRLRPEDKNLVNNLKYVRGEAGIARLELPDFFLARWWRGLGAAIGATTFFWLAMLAWWLAVGGAIFWWLRRKEMDEKKRFALLPSAAVALVLAGLCFSIGNSRNGWLENDREVVLIARIADLRVAPGADATLEKALTQGLKLRLLDEFEDYVKVALDDGKQGWLPAEAVEAI